MNSPQANPEPVSHDLARFLQAQEPVYAQALHELRSGLKRSHWMWFIFPQLAGLGRSAAAQRYAVRSIAEAKAYLDHPVLGVRLRESCRALLNVQARTAREILGTPDDLKLRSCMTLFLAARPEPEFQLILDKFFNRRPDPLTLQLLQECGALAPNGPADPPRGDQTPS